MSFSFDVVGSMLQFAAENHRDFRPQRGLAQLDGKALNITLGNLAHFGLAEGGDFIEVQAVSIERIS
jgi:hypothetical protein